jgi:hypothetical protein
MTMEQKIARRELRLVELVILDYALAHPCHGPRVA